jgi:ribosome-binding protein aMBF1 (putative translation factor)
VVDRNKISEEVKEVRQRLALAVTELRVQRGWSPEELARRARLRPALIDRIESATAVDVRIDDLSALSEALGVEVAVLLRSRPGKPH